MKIKIQDAELLRSICRLAAPKVRPNGELEESGGLIYFEAEEDELSVIARTGVYIYTLTTKRAEISEKGKCAVSAPTVYKTIARFNIPVDLWTQGAEMVVRDNAVTIKMPCITTPTLPLPDMDSTGIKEIIFAAGDFQAAVGDVLFAADDWLTTNKALSTVHCRVEGDSAYFEACNSTIGARYEFPVNGLKEQDICFPKELLQIVPPITDGEVKVIHNPKTIRIYITRDNGDVHRIQAQKYAVKPLMLDSLYNDKKRSEGTVSVSELKALCAKAIAITSAKDRGGMIMTVTDNNISCQYTTAMASISAELPCDIRCESTISCYSPKLLSAVLKGILPDDITFRLDNTTPMILLGEYDDNGRKIKQGRIICPMRF